MSSSMKKNIIRYALAALPLVIAVVPHLNFMPLWDSAIYVGCVRDGTVNGFNLWALNCSQHPSVATLLPLALAFKVFNGAIWSIHATNLILGFLALCLLLRIFDILYPETHQSERCLATACVSAMPIVAASVIHTNADYGTFLVSIVLLFSLLKRMRWLAAIASALIPLTKDPGLPIWAIIVGTFLLTSIFRREGTVFQKIKSALYFWPVLTAPFSYYWYMVERTSRNLNVLAPPSGLSSEALLSQALTISLLDPVWLSYLSAMFLVNFNWILTLIVLAGVMIWGIKQGFGASRGPEPMRRELLTLLLVLMVLLFTRFKTFVNVRYFLPLFPIMMLATFHVLQGGIPWRRVRVCILALIVVLFQLSSFRTIDPVSKRVYGSFKFGTHDILQMTSITNECCGRGRDQLVYNLEFTYFDTLTEQLLVDLRPTAAFPIVMANFSVWHYIEWITNDTKFSRSALPGEHAISAPVFSAGQLDNRRGPELPQRVIWVDLPNIHGDLEFKSLLGRYKVVEEKSYERSGYQLKAKILERL